MEFGGVWWELVGICWNFCGDLLGVCVEFKVFLRNVSRWRFFGGLEVIYTVMSVYFHRKMKVIDANWLLVGLV
jgi:hypothetical protein